MESTEKTELTGKIGTDSERESRLTALGGGRGLRGRGTQQKRKRTHGCEQKYSYYGRWGEVVGGGREYKGDKW